MSRACTALVFSLGLMAGCVSPPPAPSLREVVPSSLSAAEGGAVELKGEGFLPLGVFEFDTPNKTMWTAPVSATASNGTLNVILGSMRWVDARTVAASVPRGLPAGAWSVELTLPRGEVVTLANAFTLVEFSDEDAGVVMPCAETTLADLDDDGFGAPGTEAMLCGPGRVDAGGDCNDADALANPNGTEVCNALDDDCDGTPDDGVCRADAGASDGGTVVFVRVRTIEAMDRDFVAVSAWGPESLWLAGGDKLFVRVPDGGFLDRSSNCPMRMNAVWADSNGRAFVAGGNPGIGRITTATVMNGCAPSAMLPDPVVGLRGFTANDGGVAVEALLRDGRRATWDGTGNPTVLGNANGLTLTTGDSASRSLFFGAGRNSLNTPVVLRVRDTGAQSFDNLSALGAVPTVRGSSSISPTRLVMVGDNGFVGSRNAGVWERVPDAGVDALYAVKAFGAGRFYVSGERGQVRLWNGSWTVFPTDPLAVRAMDGVDEEHLWLVGDNGFILRRP
ncbi:MAG: putative metal-binding motif-containing protein [Archangium sp.]|nr:putative metal-binding motif-containing protein [Archangium sp.]